MISEIFYVYQLRIEDEPLPFYVGKGKGMRAYIHTKDWFLDIDLNKHKSRKINKAKRLEKQILVEFIKTDICEDDAFMWEVFWIAEYGRSDLGFGPLTNMTDGGDGTTGYKHSEYSRKLNSERKSGSNHPRWGKFGDENPTYGRKHTQAAKDKISEANRKRSPINESTRDKLSKANSGENNPRYGVEVSEETRERLSKANSQSWLVTDPNGFDIQIFNLKAFCKSNGLTISAMYNVAKGICKHHKGYTCRKMG